MPRQALAALAGTPDDSPSIDAWLKTLAQLAARAVEADYASITAVRDGADVTVAASSELAVAVDEPQYADDDDPCLQALASGVPVGVPLPDVHLISRSSTCPAACDHRPLERVEAA